TLHRLSSRSRTRRCPYSASRQEVETHPRNLEREPRETVFRISKCAAMLALRDNIAQSLDSLRAHKLRAVLTIIGLTMGVATLITVMTIVQGANSYVENKIANLGTNVFQLAKTPFAATNFDIVIKALRYKDVTIEDMRAIAERCPHCELVGASVSAQVHARAENKEVEGVTLDGQTPNMVNIDTRNVVTGRYFT